jgi:hypothetical protein
VSLRKGLTRLEGVAEAKLIIKPPHMLVRMKPGAWPDFAKMQQTIKDAGFKAIENGVELRVSGRVVKQGEQLVLEVDKMTTPVTLQLKAAKDDPDTLDHLNHHIGELVELDGNWQPPEEGKAGPGSLAVIAIPRTAPAMAN